MIIPRSLAWTLLLAGFFVSGLLRQWHYRGPALGLLSVLMVLLLILWYRSQRSPDPRSAVPPTPDNGVPMKWLLAFLFLVLGEKWISLALLEPALAWIPVRIENPWLADALYRLLTGLGLIGVCLGGLFLFRPRWPELARLLSLRALGTAVVVIAVSVTALYGLTFGFLWVVRDQIPSQWGVYEIDDVMKVILAAQVVRAASEELFFRGLLQEGLVSFLGALGLRPARRAKMAAVGLVSLLFVLEHAHMDNEPFGVIGRQLAFVFTLSVLFGLALVVSRSLYLTMGFHLTVNLFINRAGVVFLDMRDGGEVFEPQHFILLHAVLLFLVLFALSGRRRRARRRRQRADAAAAMASGEAAPPVKGI